MLGLVGVGDACGAEHDAQWPERDAVAIRQAAAAQYRRAGRDARHDLMHQARFAGAGVTDHGDHAHRGPVDDLAIDARDLGQLGVAAHDRRVAAAHVTVQTVRADQPKRGHSLGLALELQRFDRFHLDRIAHQPVRHVAEVDLVLGRRLLQPRRDVHGVAGGQLLVGSRVVVGHHLTGVDTGAVGQRDAIALAQVLVHARERALHPDRRAHRAHGVVLVGARQAEHRHDGVADVLLDLAAMASDLGGHRLEVALLDFVQCLGVEGFAQRRRPLEVAEDDGHRLAHLVHRQRRRRGDQRRAAVTAQPELRRVLLAATGASNHFVRESRGRLKGAAWSFGVCVRTSRRHPPPRRSIGG